MKHMKLVHLHFTMCGLSARVARVIWVESSDIDFIR